MKRRTSRLPHPVARATRCRGRKAKRLTKFNWKMNVLEFSNLSFNLKSSWSLSLSQVPWHFQSVVSSDKFCRMNNENHRNFEEFLQFNEAARCLDNNLS